MRITNSMMMENYMDTLSGNLEGLSDSYSKVSSEKKFTRVSEDPVDAMKTLKTLHRMSQTSQHGDNISQATSDMTNTESTLNTVTSILSKAQEDILAANNAGVKSSGDYKTYANELSSLRDQLLDTLNSTFDGNYVFGGDAGGPAPFQFDSSTGKLMIYDYNGTSGSKQYVDFDANLTQANQNSYNLSNKIDVGLGLSVTASGSIVSDTAFEAATSAVSLLGLTFASGATTTTNMFDMLSNTINKLGTAASANVAVDLKDEVSEVYQAQDNTSSAITVVGQKSSMLSFLSDRNKTLTSNQTTRLSSLEDIDIESAIMEYETRQVVYNASLAVGPKILQKSLIDFMS